MKCSFVLCSKFMNTNKQTNKNIFSMSIYILLLHYSKTLFLWKPKLLPSIPLGRDSAIENHHQLHLPNHPHFQKSLNWTGNAGIVSVYVDVSNKSLHTNDLQALLEWIYKLEKNVISNNFFGQGTKLIVSILTFCLGIIFLSIWWDQIIWKCIILLKLIAMPTGCLVKQVNLTSSNNL